MKAQNSISEQSEESSDKNRVNCKAQNCLRIFCLFALFFSCSVVQLFSCYAQDATPPAETKTRETKEAPSPKESQLEKIRNLKERVATKVAELKKKAKKAYFGEIKEISDSTIFLLTKKGEVIVKIDEETKIFEIGVGGREKITLKDLKEGESIVAFGILEEEELSAKIILVKKMPVIINGKVTEVNTEGGTITVKTSKEGEFIVDYEATTKCRIFEKGKGLVKGGLSKITVDDRIHVVGTAGEGENRITALRILVLPGKALGIIGKEATPTATIAPSP